MIFVLGSINMDFVGRVPHLPKMGETLTCEEFYSNLGGKGANHKEFAGGFGARNHCRGNGN